MTTKARWGVGIAIVAAVIAVGVGLVTADDGGTSQVSGDMTGGNSMGTGMMGSSSGSMSSGSMSGGMMGETSGGMMGSGSMGSGTMGAGTTSMMSGADMEGMHEQMMAALGGKVPSNVLARCDALHDQMWSNTRTDGVGDTGHLAHHANAGSTG
ncbi:MAG: hypothetical protein WEE66_06585 [Actinomycetota bacterium]